MIPNTPRRNLIQLDQVCVTLTGGGGPVNVLHNIDLSLHAGERVALLGPSGSGKTTLLMALAGLEPPSSGRILFQDDDLTRARPEDIVRWRGRHIGIVFQAFHLIATMTALENVALTLELQGDRRATSKAREALSAVGLSHRLSHYPSQLSGGEQQRVAIARAVVGHPSLLLADEPTGNLDGQTGDQVMKLLFERQTAQGSSMLLVTHDPLLAQQCDRILHMKNGRLIQDDPVSNRAATAT